MAEVGARATPDDIRAELEGLFSRLDTDVYSVESEYDASYNCAAFAVEDKERWWEPLTPDGYWPPKIPAEVSVDAYVAAFETVGFRRCESPDVEAGFEKLAIYSEDSEFMHAARQLPTGEWVSKLGKLEDIKHRALEQLSGSHYGSVAVFMKRKTA